MTIHILNPVRRAITSRYDVMRASRNAVTQLAGLGPSQAHASSLGVQQSATPATQATLLPSIQHASPVYLHMHHHMAFCDASEDEVQIMERRFGTVLTSINLMASIF